MHRVDTSTAVAALPPPEPAGAPGFFSKGDPNVGQTATVPGQDWFNAVQEEAIHILSQAGIEPVKGVHTQLMAAIVKHITDRVAGFVIYPDAPEFISATQFRVPGNRTAFFHTNRRVKVVDLTTFGETIKAQSYDGVGNKTTVTITNDNGSMTAALAAISSGIGDPHKPIHAIEVADLYAPLQRIYEEITARTVFANSPRLQYVATATAAAPITFTSLIGSQIRAITITPKLQNSRIRVRASVQVNESTNTDTSTALAVFKDSDSNPLRTVWHPNALSGAFATTPGLDIDYEFAQMGGAAISIKFRAAIGDEAGTGNTTMVINGGGPSSRTDNIPGMVCTFLVEEYLP